MSNTRLKLRRLLRLDLALLTVSVVFFLLFPQVDLFVAGNYYDGHSFIYADNPVVRFIYVVFAKIHIAYLLLFIGAIIYCSRKRWHSARKKWLFLLLALLLGPGILVNLALKDNSVGRPRPQQIQQFGGGMTFAPVFHYSGACAKNCSFVSGHAAIGFYLMAIAWVRQRRIWIAYGLTLGVLVGFVRILQGGHFLSDVVFAGWVTYFTCVILAQIMRFHYPSKKTTKPSPPTNVR